MNRLNLIVKRLIPLGNKLHLSVLFGTLVLLAACNGGGDDNFDQGYQEGGLNGERNLVFSPDCRDYIQLDYDLVNESDIATALQFFFTGDVVNDRLCPKKVGLYYHKNSNKDSKAVHGSIMPEVVITTTMDANGNPIQPTLGQEFYVSAVANGPLATNSEYTYFWQIGVDTALGNNYDPIGAIVGASYDAVPHFSGSPHTLNNPHIELDTVPGRPNQVKIKVKIPTQLSIALKVLEKVEDLSYSEIRFLCRFEDSPTTPYYCWDSPVVALEPVNIKGNNSRTVSGNINGLPVGTNAKVTFNTFYTSGEGSFSYNYSATQFRLMEFELGSNGLFSIDTTNLSDGIDYQIIASISGTKTPCLITSGEIELKLAAGDITNVQIDCGTAVPLTVTMPQIPNMVVGGNQSLYALTTGGTLPYYYHWTVSDSELWFSNYQFNPVNLYARTTAKSGSYTVSLHVTDANGGDQTVSTTVTVVNGVEALTAAMAITGTYANGSGTSGPLLGNQPITINATGSVPLTNIAQFNYSITPCPPTPATCSFSSSTNQDWVLSSLTASNYTVMLTITDSAGSTDSVTQSFDVIPKLMTNGDISDELSSDLAINRVIVQTLFTQIPNSQYQFQLSLNGAVIADSGKIRLPAFVFDDTNTQVPQASPGIPVVGDFTLLQTRYENNSLVESSEVLFNRRTIELTVVDEYLQPGNVNVISGITSEISSVSTTHGLYNILQLYYGPDELSMQPIATLYFSTNPSTYAYQFDTQNIGPNMGSPLPISGVFHIERIKNDYYASGSTSTFYTTIQFDNFIRP